MRDAGLTHGAFYAHFDNKQELADAAFTHAITTGRSHWIAGPQGGLERPTQAAGEALPSPRPIATISAPRADSPR